jgi:uncharacterized protein YegL
MMESAYFHNPCFKEFHKAFKLVFREHQSKVKIQKKKKPIANINAEEFETSTLSLKSLEKEKSEIDHKVVDDEIYDEKNISLEDIIEIWDEYAKIQGNFYSKLKSTFKFLRLISLILIITALARPQVIDTSTRVKTNSGIDIIMAIDVSASMLAKDLKPNRLDALKNVADEFIKNRVSDRIGLVEYAGESYTKTPLTSDKTITLRSLREIKYNNIIEGGTAIGMGLATSVNRIKDSKAKSKVIILLTDGVNNAGFIDPITAAELAKEFQIKIYSIGLGTNGLRIKFKRSDF